MISLRYGTKTIQQTSEYNKKETDSEIQRHKTVVTSGEKEETDSEIYRHKTVVTSGEKEEGRRKTGVRE